MRRLGQGMATAGSALAVLALFAALSGCAEFKAFVARQFAPPAVTEASPERSPAIRPTDSSNAAHYRLARFYGERGRHHEAVLEFRKMIEADPMNAKAWNGLGVSLDALGRYQDASQAYAEALRLDPGLDYVHNNLGSSLARRGDRAAATAAFEKAVALNPDNAVARGNLAKLSAPTPAACSGAVRLPEMPVSKQRSTPVVASAPPVLPGATSGAIRDIPPQAPPTAIAAAGAPVPAQPVAIPPSIATAQGSSPLVAMPAHAADAPLPQAVPTEVLLLEASPARQTATASPPHDSGVVFHAPDPSTSPPVRVRHVSPETLREENPLEVANESGSSKLLGAVTARLAAHGYTVEVAAASARTDRTKTLILYREGALQPAYQVAQIFPGYQEMKKTETFDRADSSIRVLLGRDMAAYRKSFAATAGAR